MTDTPIKDAATVILVRDAGTAPRVLMGQRGKSAVFMPGKFVFPGGAVDASDSSVPLAEALPDRAARSLQQSPSAATPEALAVAAIRELWEETGLILGQKADWPDAPPDWAGFAEQTFRPTAAAFSFVFRAVTPPGKPRRFDARFLMADAQAVAGDLDDFSQASDELSHLQWVPLTDARHFDLPFITTIVLAEIAQQLPSFAQPERVPHFLQNEEQTLFETLKA